VFYLPLSLPFPRLAGGLFYRPNQGTFLGGNPFSCRRRIDVSKPPEKMRIKGFPGRSVKSAEAEGQARGGEKAREKREKEGKSEDERGNERTGPVGEDGRAGGWGGGGTVDGGKGDVY